ncbi:phosphoribosylanthranilate isomerase [Algiphilus sp.]|uniref:phosphoribosylanthranilate isomerase n=1 Tax=Algiphilus sp. TaxID=1872431 RepID=UPI0025C068C4|nr:phosphoribosylanthranilate isomerase [Algiphilus sp.]MCK5770266.1 phosphoribosylanthranilate isomerase [Algiphilus sp.]
MSHRTRVKICGVTRREDALHAARCGADAVGVVFVPASPRAIGVDEAVALRGALPPFVQLVALFMDSDRDAVSAVCERVAPDLLQFHGSEDAAFCTAFGLRYIKAVAAADGTDLEAASRAHPSAAGLLIDGHGTGEMGGSGQRVTPGALSGASTLPLVLAGGLAPGNVADAVRQFRPWAVDVSSGVESAPGEKDPRKVAAFIEEVGKGDDQ